MVLQNVEKVEKGIWQPTKSASNWKHKTNKVTLKITFNLIT